MEILGLVLMIPGLVTIYLAKRIANKYKVCEKVFCSFEDELTDEELTEYKNNRAVLIVKIIGMIMLFPGLIWIIISQWIN